MTRPRYNILKSGSQIIPELLNVYEMLFRTYDKWEEIQGHPKDETTKDLDPSLLRLKEYYGRYSPSFLIKQDPLGNFVKTVCLQRLVQIRDHKNFLYLFSLIEELQERDLIDIITELLDDKNHYISAIAEEAFKYPFVIAWGTRHEEVLRELAKNSDDRLKTLIERVLGKEQ
jgi:hypothetical protein